MNFFNLFKKQHQVATTYGEFWSWFAKHEKTFHRIIARNQNIENNFLDKVFEQMSYINSSIFLLAGVLDDGTAEVVFSPDGSVKNIVFTEDLVSAAPKLSNWKFTALKPAVKDVSIEYAGHVFSADNLSFTVRNQPEFPDQIDITLVYPQLVDDQKDDIFNGAMIFLDNFLGELKTVTLIDSVEIVSEADPSDEIIAISKLPDYLVWREKEFVEKYEGKRKDTENDSYTTATVELENGLPVIATFNADLLDWDAKASHPWILHIEIEYEGLPQTAGMPDPETYEIMDEFELSVIEKLRDVDGYLNVGRETGGGIREIFIACKEFRESSRKVSAVIATFASKLSVNHTIYKDKYWQSLERFRFESDEQQDTDADE